MMAIVNILKNFLIVNDLHPSYRFILKTTKEIALILWQKDIVSFDDAKGTI
jgi:hypothetical protein